MRVFVEVKSCAGCPYCSITKPTDDHDFYLMCHRSNGLIGTAGTAEEAIKKEIPDWCPFKIKEEQNEAIRQQERFDRLMKGE